MQALNPTWSMGKAKGTPGLSETWPEKQAIITLQGFRTRERGRQ